MPAATSVVDTLGSALGITTPTLLGIAPTVNVGVPNLHVTIGGTDYTDTVLGASLSYGLDIGIASATIDFISVEVTPAGYPVELVGINYFDVVTISCGSDPLGPNWDALRFTGLFLRVEATMWPGVFQVVCKGNLYRAAQYYQASIFVGLPSDLFQGVPIGSPLTTDSPNATDAAGNVYTGYVDGQLGVDTTDKHIVQSILQAVPVLGPSIDPNNIHGTGDSGDPGIRNTPAIILASYFDAVWPPYRSAWEQVQLFDQAFLGYRTFEGLAGTIYRSLIYGYPNAIADAAFVEGIDIWEAHTTRTVEPLINSSYVEGMTDAAGASIGKVVFTFVQQGNPFQSVPVVEQFRSPFIETSDLLDPDHLSSALRAEEVARWRLAERNRELVNVTLTTYRDDLLGIGRTITVNSPHAAISQPVWIQRVEIQVQNQPALFQQTIYGLGGGLPGYGSDLPYNPPPSLM